MRPRKPLKITSRVSSVTNGFVQAILPDAPPTAAEIAEAAAILGMDASDLRCVYCGVRSTDWDHLRPLVRGKRPTGYLNNIRNLVPACGPCNQSKSGQDWRNWMEGNARGSPTTRGVEDLPGKIAALQRFEQWEGRPSADLKAIAGAERWERYWEKLAEIERLMFEAQKDAEVIRARISAAIGRE
ncbi:HNH endonuclease [Sphingomonas sp. KR3-1]|uniref:HNH endonuclease n=1 Tax=Sphingomonas sp. KR3-1 TaxID=3156611 RepID=UPI0032B346CC